MTTYTWINIAMAVYLAFKFYRGWHKGVLLSLLSTLGTFLCVYGAYYFSGQLADTVSLYPKSSVPFSGTLIGDAIYPYLNRIILAVLLFAVLKIVLLLAEGIISSIRKLPGIHAVSRLCGGIFGLLTGGLVLAIVCVFLHLPLISNGEDIIAHTGFAYIDTEVQKAGEKVLGSSYQTYLDLMNGRTDSISTDAIADTIEETYQNMNETQKEEVNSVLSQYGVSDIDSLKAQYDSLSEQQKEQLKHALSDSSLSSESTEGDTNVQ